MFIDKSMDVKGFWKHKVSARRIRIDPILESA
jgi:hypothetical protein